MRRDASAWLLFFALAGCGYDDLLGNEGFEIDCDGKPCDWKLLEGDADLTASWHDGDPGADFSGTGRAVIEQRSAPFTIPVRELFLGPRYRPRGGVHPRRARLVHRRPGGGAELLGSRAAPGRHSRLRGRGERRVRARGAGVHPVARGQRAGPPHVKDGEGMAIIDEVYLSDQAVAVTP